MGKTVSILCSSLVLGAFFASGATFFVDQNSLSDGPGSSWDNAFRTIQGGVDASSDGDTVWVSNGVYTLSSQVVVTSGVTVGSINGWSATTVDGADAGRVFYLSGGAEIDGFTIKNGLTNGYGGGVLCVSSGMIANCVVVSNEAYGGGGIHLDGGGTVRNSMVAHNWASSDWGGGISCSNGSVLSCVVADNDSIAAGGGIGWEDSITVHNSIVFDNGADAYPNWGEYGSSGNGEWMFCCTTRTNELPGSEGCIEVDPMFAEYADTKYGLHLESPCRNAGTNEGWMIGTKDLYGNPRIIGAAVDMGGFEVPYGEDPGSSPIHYVSTNGLAIWPYTNWLTAAKIMQEAVSAASSDDTVLVTNGVYDEGGLKVGWLSNRVMITRPITLRSVNGRAVTKIVGAADPSTTNGPLATRCLYVTNGVSVSGFTFMNGHTESTGSVYSLLCGGGVCLDGVGGVISNCTIQSCSAMAGGGLYWWKGATVVDSRVSDCTSVLGAAGIYGVAAGVIENCTISSNVTLDGGGGLMVNSESLVKGCTISGNRAADGGGVYLFNSTLDRCVISSNESTRDGGGVLIYVDATLVGCRISENTAGRDGGGVDMYGGGTLEYCHLYGNTAVSNGGGAHTESALIKNCTVNSNTAGVGGGVYLDSFSTVKGCVVWNNMAVSTNDNWYSGTGNNCIYSCSIPRMPGVGIITNNPLFEDEAAGECRLQAGSPCIDAAAGINLPFHDMAGMVGPLDGDNDGRVVADMGCYEYLNSAADTDQDGWTDGTEAAQGTDPAHSDVAAANIARAEVTNNPAAYGLYTSNSISDLDMGYMMIQVTGSTVNLSLQLMECTNLSEDVWNNAGAPINWQRSVVTNKSFYRIHGQD